MSTRRMDSLVFHPVHEKSKSFMNLLQKLDLKDSYPKQMTKSSVLVIDRLSQSMEEPKTEKDLSAHYLYKVMMLDYRFRYLCVKPEIGVDSVPDAEDGDGDDDFFDCDDNSELLVSSQHAHIHPMDLHMAIFHCSSDFLRQFIFTKLSDCQFSLPFLVPNPCTAELEFPLWPLRHIRKSWHSKTQTASDGNVGVKYHNKDMFSTPVPIVSFFRLGISDSNSKSQILNGVINKQKHTVFFHRHCEGSTPDSLLMNGVVEIAWYCPGGKEDDVFDDCVAFLNLHGDAAEHPRQLEFLQAVSAVNVVLLSEHPMTEKPKMIAQELKNSPAPLICLFSAKDKVRPSKIPTKVRLAAKKRNQAEFTEELIASIKQCISERKKTASIEMCCEEAKKQQFIVDEDKDSIKEGRAKAETLMCVLHSMKDNKKGTLHNLKGTILPLQGKLLWHEWCIKNKERFRIKMKKDESIQMHLSKITSQMTEIRRIQCEQATPLNDFIRSFLECLTKPAQFKETHTFILQWLRILLDELSTGQLAPLEQEYHLTWLKMKDLSHGKDEASNVDRPQKTLDDIVDEMAATTIGIQHIMREVSQLYEACEHTDLYKTLPKIGVNMLISGYPLELMDGDAAHVPSVWINAVLDELIKTLGNKKVFVLSILGIQSSGKSTLLNTMFGLQFAVSAGRCTRGAFMQLLEVDQKSRKELGYDFVLIVDTEGLRSPELSTKVSLNHDNELATFIIGIGDVTVINIMGENPSDMQDILQICVQAFLRMKQVKFTPSCIFVHQNVADASAGDKNKEGRRRLLEKLNEMAEMAAKEEKVTGITSFSDVIQFDIDTQVFYFKNLLEGDPPMAPINPSYSQNVQQIKTKLLRIKTWQRKCTFSSLSEFKYRVTDLWEALLQENFVFSFKNTVEMMVYSSLEQQYGVWSWELRKHALSLQATLENQICSDLIQGVTLDTVKEELDKVYNPLKAKMEKYFSEDKSKETLIQWKTNIELRFRGLKDELIDGIRKVCKELFTAKQNRSELDQKKAKYTKQLTERSKELALTISEQGLTDDKIREAFDKLWGAWTTDMMKYQQTENPLRVEAIVENVLLDEFQNLKEISEKLKEKTSKDPKKPPKHFFQIFQNNSNQVFQKKVSDEVNHYITTKEHAKKEFDPNFIYEILKIISNKYESEEISGHSKSKEFLVDLSIDLCLKNIPRFKRMHEEFRTANQPLTYFQSQRQTYFQTFKNYCKRASSVTIFVEFLCNNITPAVLDASNNKISWQIADGLKNNDDALSGNRSNLENHILRDLVFQENFERYEEYIDHPNKYFQRFLQEKVNKFCLDRNTLHTLHQENLKSLKDHLLKANREVTKEVREMEGNASLWLKLFCEKVGAHLVIKKDDLRSIENEDITDWQFLRDTMATSLEVMIKDVPMNVQDFREKPTTILFQQLQGCWAQCPFCKAICTNHIPNHDGDHSVRYHRNEALIGRYWSGTYHFAIEFCTASVSSDAVFRKEGEKEWIPYKNYRAAGEPYNKWNINGDGSSQYYWKWFLCKFQSEWEKKYDKKFTGRGQIPPNWKTVNKEDILKELANKPMQD